MTAQGVLRPGFVQLRVLDMEEAIRHYTKIIGLDVVGREADGRVYLHAYDEFDRHSIILRQAEEAGMDVMGFKVASDAALDRFADGLKARGLAVEDIPEGEQPGVGRRVRFRSPTGHLFDLYARMELSATGPMVENPDVWRDPPQGAGAIRFDHCLLYGVDIDATMDVFVDVLGFQLTEQVIDADNGMTIALFLTCSNKAHDIALVRHQEDGKFHHCSFLLQDWNAVGHAADLMTRNNVSVDIGPTRHGITRGQTIYFWDPSGNRNEVFAGGYTHYADHPVRTWTSDQTGKAIFYYEKALNDTFLTVVT